MDAKNFDVAALLRMAHSPVKNYAIPGLVSSLIGNPGPNGTVRVFECTRDHVEPITPHSHRFGFQCWVLKGRVTNRIWRKDPAGDLYQASQLTYCGEIGAYKLTPGKVDRWGYTDERYVAGECYSMRAHEIHSIYFQRGTIVLFFEEQNASESSLVLQPWVDGEAVPTFEVKPWMFKRANVALGEQLGADQALVGGGGA